MKNCLLGLILILTACNPASVPPPPAPIVFASPNFIFQGEDPSRPIVAHSPSPQFDHLYINPGALILHEGQFHLFFNSFTQWPGKVMVGYMRSDDDYHWNLVQDEPIFVTDQIPFGDGKADVSSMLVMADGLWVMYFHTVSSGAPPPVIGRATSPSPLGPWQVDPTPVLGPGQEGSWDENGLFWPNALKDDQGYRIYYGAKNKRGNLAIGLATSTDGINWTKYDDPATTEAALAESDPVLQTLAKWELNKVDRPRVQFTPDGWVMIYQGGRIEMRGLALSDDGIHWTTYPDNPLFTREDFPIPGATTWDTALLYHQNKYYYYMEIGTLSATDLYLAIHQGPLRK